MKEQIELAKVYLSNKDLYAPHGPERCGFIRKDNTVIEVDNVAKDPLMGFVIAPIAVAANTDDDLSWATWHTHPGQDANLSHEDYQFMNNWADLVHFIIGSDGVRAYMYDAQEKILIYV